MFTVIVPAHNEAAVIGRLLRGLTADLHPGEAEIVVVANGCTDDTTNVAAAHGEPVRVIDTSTPGKYAAMRLGDEHAKAYPRLYVDADVELDTASARSLAAALAGTDVLAAAPERVLDLNGSALIVRWYYHVWQRLPSVRANLFGRGVIAVNEEGHRRLLSVPDVMGDDLAAAVAFTDAERRIVGDATVIVRAPRTVDDLLKRRVRSLTSTAQLQARLPVAVGGARTGSRDLVRMGLSRPHLIPKLAVFLGVTLVARRRARKPIQQGDYTTWLRDESSRAS